MMKAWTYLALALLLAGCTADGRRTGASPSGKLGPKITKQKAVQIAQERLQDEDFAKDIDPTRMTINHGEFGPRKNVKTCWIVDFARRGAQEITPGQWDRGYQVAIDSETGVIVEATEYER